MKPGKTKPDHGLFKVHLTGALVCATIAGGSIWFAADSVAKRRGLFLSARHELTNTKERLNDTVSKRTALVSRVQHHERLTSEQLDLVPVKQLNARSQRIARLAESLEISIDSLQPMEMITDARVPVQPLELLGSAKADTVSDLLSALDEQMPDMHIQAIELKSESLGSDRVSLRLLFYWFVDPADEG